MFFAQHGNRNYTGVDTVQELELSRSGVEYDRGMDWGGYLVERKKVLLIIFTAKTQRTQRILFFIFTAETRLRQGYAEAGAGKDKPPCPLGRIITRNHRYMVRQS